MIGASFQRIQSPLSVRALRHSQPRLDPQRRTRANRLRLRERAAIRLFTKPLAALADFLTAGRRTRWRGFWRARLGLKTRQVHPVCDLERHPSTSGTVISGVVWPEMVNATFLPGPPEQKLSGLMSGNESVMVTIPAGGDPVESDPPVMVVQLDEFSTVDEVNSRELPVPSCQLESWNGSRSFW